MSISLLSAVASAADAEPAAVVSSKQDAFIVDSERASVAIKSRVQLRYQLSTDLQASATAVDPQQLVTIGTARVYLNGHLLSRDLTYQVQLAVADRDYRDGAKSPVYDAYLDYRAHRDLQVRVGQFFVPFDRLRTIREYALQLAERPRPVGELTLDRDVGIMVYSNAFLGDGSPFAFRLGAFGGGGMNQSTAKAAGGLLVARLELRPLGGIDDDEEGDLKRRENAGIALGVAAARNWNSNRQKSTTGATFTGGTVDQSHLAADAVFKWEGLALQGEYLWKRSATDVIVSTNSDGSTKKEPTRSAYGWIAQASYVFETPYEVAARASRMTAISGTDPAFVADLHAHGQEFAFGVNRYLNGHRFKLQATWIARTPRDIDFTKAEHTAYVLVDATM
jgi:hypothetical protein